MIVGVRKRLLTGISASERRLDLAGVRTGLLEGGQGPPIVLLHGVGSFALEWGLIFPRLAECHRVVAPDLPGLGESEVSAGKRDAAAAVAWLGELIAQTCPEPPTLVGHSLGGGLA